MNNTSESQIRFTNDERAPVLAWYYACPSSELEQGRILSCTIAAEDVVLYRGQSGSVYVLGANCPHMGAHLGVGEVIGEGIRCALHHRVYCGDGYGAEPVSPPRPPRSDRPAKFAVAERHGSIFIFNAPEPHFPPPEFVSVRDGELLTLAGQPLTLDCPWQAIVANGFDAEHLGTVHKRQLKQPPDFTQSAPHCLTMNYTSSVTGASLADRFMKWVSRNHIRVTVRCWGGPVILVESDLGRVRSALILSIQTHHGASVVRAVYCLYRSRNALFDRLRLRMARWLFESFFLRDIAIMDKMRFRVPQSAERDPLMDAIVRFLHELPRKVSDISTQPMIPEAKREETKKRNGAFIRLRRRARSNWND